MSEPTPPPHRVYSLDVLRGFAVMGMLLMNIGMFALPDSARVFPDSIPNNSGLNFAIWTTTVLFVGGVFRGLFSMLFGAGVLLFTQRSDARIPREDVADLYYKRTLWLIAFGLAHAYVLLGGTSILFLYGFAGLLLFPFRRLDARRLLAVGLLVLAVPLPLTLRATVARFQSRAAAARTASARAAGAEVSAQDGLLAARWGEWVRDHGWSPEEQEAEARLRESGYWVNLRHVVAADQSGQSTAAHRELFWDVTGMMFLGMAFFKRGVLSAERSGRFYLWLAAGGLAGGLATRGATLYVTVANGFDPFAITFAQSTYDAGRLLMALGYIGVIMLLCRSGRLRGLTRCLSAVGRMALTNFILQSVICVMLFYGVGFGLFGMLERGELLGIVGGIWAFEIIGSRLWLSHFRFGPLEWLWRTLTYGARQPLRIGIAAN